MVSCVKITYKRLLLLMSILLASIFLSALVPANLSFNRLNAPDLVVSNDDDSLAYATVEDEQVLLLINLTTGEIEENFKLNFPARIMGINSDQRYIILKNTALGTLLKVNLNAEFICAIDGPKGAINHMVVSQNDQKIYATYEGSSQVFCLDLEKNCFFPLVNFSIIPNCLSYHALSNCLYVSFKTTGDIITIHLNDLSTTPVTTLAASPNSIDISQDGKKIAAICSQPHTILMMNIAEKTIETLNDKAGVFVIDEETTMNYVNNSLYITDAPTGGIYHIDLKTKEQSLILNLNKCINNFKCVSLPLLNASFKLTPILGGAKFDASATSCLKTGVLDYEWNFGDGVIKKSKEPLIEHVYETSGTYVATLIAAHIESLHNQTTQLSPSKNLIAKSHVSFAINVVKKKSPQLSQQTSSEIDISRIQLLAGLGTTTSLSSSANPSVFNQSITLTATVASGSGVPTGLVTFKDGATSVGTGSLDGSGVAILSISALSVGTHSLTAVYVGDGTYDTSTSSLLSQVVNKGPTSTTMSSSVNPSVFGQATTLNATVSAITPSSGIPTGIVTFKDGTTTIGTGTLNPAGSATVSISNLTTGTHSLSAVYGSDANFDISTSSPLSQVVNKGTTTTAINTSINPSTYGQSITLSAMVSVTGAAIGIPTGTVTFKDGGTTIVTQSLSGNVATIAVNNLSVGTHTTLTAVYNGDTNFNASTSPNLTPAQVVNQATPTVTLTSDVNPSTFGDIVTFTSVVLAPTSIGLPSGTVTFQDGATVIGIGNLTGSGNSSTATLTLNTLSGGAHFITAIYNGDTNFTQAQAPSLTQNVVQASTAVSIVSLSRSPIEYGEPLLMKAIIIGSVNVAPLPPSGTVGFYSDGVLLGSAVINTVVNAYTASVTFQYTGPPLLTLGIHQLQAKYLGDVNYTSGVSPLLSQSVTSTTTSTVSTPTNTPSKYGQATIFTTTVTANAPGRGQPSGTIQYYDGVMSIGLATLVGVPNTNTSIATFTVPTVLNIGTHKISSVYSGDLVNSNYTSSVAAPFNQVVVKDETTTTLTTSFISSNFGSPITLTAAVTANMPGSGTPTGKVTFKDGAVIIGTGTLNNGVATLTTCRLLPGNAGSALVHHLTATYLGDIDFISSASTDLPHTIIGTLTTLTTIIAASENPVAVSNIEGFNDPVIFTAKVVANSACPLFPITGTVTFEDAGAFIGTGTIVNGIAKSPPINFYTLGHHAITAIFNGDSLNNYYIASTSSTYDQCVVPSETTILLTTAPNHSTQNSSVLMAQVTANPIGPGFEIGGGTLTFYDDNGAIAGGSDLPVPNSGLVELPMPTLCFGCQNIYAVYSGDCTYYDMSTSNTVNQQVQQTDMLSTKTIVSQNGDHSYLCEPTTFTASIIEIISHCNQTPIESCMPTGTVTFFDEGTSIGTAVIENGIATLVVSDLGIGSHPISAAYNSDSNFAFSISDPISHIVNTNPTTTTLALIPVLSSTPYGQPITFIAQVASLSGAIPSGSIVFSHESGTFATIDLDATGQALFETDLIDAGSHTFIATYEPSCCGTATACFSPSISSPNVHVITRASADLALNATPSPANYGDMIILNGTIASYDVGIPSGVVSFYKGATLFATVPIVNGIAMLPISNYVAGVNIPAGLVTFRAMYSGDVDFLTTQFPSATITINKVSPTISIISDSPNPSLFGQTVNLSAEVFSLISIPTGSVTFFDGITLLATIPLGSNGIARLDVANLSIGSHSITVRYNGDNNFLTITSPTLSQTVSKDDTITTVTSSGSTTFGAAAMFNVTVRASVPGGGTPTGTITASFGSVSLGSQTLNGGTASFTTTLLPVGTNTITLTYNGDSNFNPSLGVVTKTVNLAASTTLITLSMTPSVFGQAVTVNTHVASTAGTPSGAVSFKEGTVTYGTAILDSSSNASLLLTNLSVGSHPITAVYSGAGNFAASTSLASIQVVNPGNTTINLTSSLSTTSYGQEVTLRANVVPTSPSSGTPSGNVIFKDGPTTLGIVPLGIGGIAILTTSSFAAITHGNVTATYVGDTNFTTSTSNLVSLSVQPAATVTTAVSLANPTNVGAPFSVDVTVNAVDTGVVIPNGTVQAFYNNVSISNAISLDVNGKASIPLTSATINGPYPIVIKYIPTLTPQNFKSSTGTLDQVINKLNSQITLSSSLNPSSSGQSVTFNTTITSSSGTPTGTVSFFDANSLLGIQTVTASGAQYTTSNLSVGTHQITAVYNGDASINASTSLVIPQVINAGQLSISLTSSINPSQIGQPTLLTAMTTITAGLGNVSGTITFKDGALTLGTGMIINGVATYSTSFSSAGIHSLTAIYSGDSNFATAVSPILNQLVSAATATTSLITNPNPSQFGNNVALTATVVPSLGRGTVTGFVQFKEGSTSLSSPVALINGVAILNKSDFNVGSHTLSAVYSGDTNFGASTSLSVIQIVQTALPLISLSSTINPSVYGQTITLTATLNSTNPHPTGNVEFREGSQVLGVGAVNSDGVATFSLSLLSVDLHLLTANYLGDGHYSPAMSAEYSQVVNQRPTTTTIASSLNPSVYGQAINFNATVLSNTLTDPIPTGSVSFEQGTLTLGTALLDANGQASISLSNLSIGSHPISVVYGGAINFAPSNSSSFLQVINQATTSTNISSSKPLSSFGEDVTFIATVIPTLPGAGIPTGHVLFKDGPVTLGTVSLGIGGSASFTTSLLAAGLHSTITAVYEGDNNFMLSTSSILLQTVQPAETITTAISLLNPRTVGDNFSVDVTVNATDAGGITPVGTVQAFYNNVAISAAVSLASGKASISLVSLPPAGAYPIVIKYTPNGNFVSSAGALDLMIEMLTTSTTLTSSSNPSLFGQAITFTANVSVPSGHPTGSVSFFDGGTLLSIQMVNAGIAQITMSSLSVGTHSLQAVYNGDANYSSSSSPVVNQIVSMRQTSVSLSSSVNPTEIGQETILLAAITTVGNPSGTITFEDGTTILDTITVINGVATLPISFSTSGLHTLTAIYNGDMNFTGSTSESVDQVVITAITHTSVTTNPNPSYFGSPVTLTAVVNALFGSDLLTGTVQFKDGSSLIGTLVAVVNGLATINQSDLSVGSHSISAVYSGDAAFSPSTSLPVIQVVTKTLTSVTLTSTVNPSVSGQPITLIASLQIQSPLQTGTVTFMEGSQILGTSDVNSAGLATLTISSLAVDLHLLTASYSGDATYNPALSNEYTQVVNPGQTTTTISSSLNPSLYGQNIILTASVAVNPLSLDTIAFGYVDFIEAGDVIGTGVLQPSGYATFSSSIFDVGTHPITAVYRGNDDVLPSSSSVLSQVVNKALTITTVASIHPNPSIFGDVVSFIATTTPVTTVNGVQPTGFVQFYNGANALGAPVVTNGVAILETSLIAIGSYQITAVYLGDKNFVPSTSLAVPLDIKSQQFTFTSLTTLTSDINPQSFGCEVTFHVSVVSQIAPPPAGVPTGIVTIYQGVVPLATVALNNSGQASFSTSSLPAGTLTIVALYSGDTNYSASTKTMIQEITPLNTNIALTSSIEPSIYHQPVIFTAHVTAFDCQSNVVIPTGYVSFYDEALLVATTLLDGQGNATFMTRDLSTGSHEITAVYNSTRSFDSSQTSLLQMVTCRPTSTTLLISAPNPSTLGNVVSFFASVSADDGIPTGSMTFMDNDVPIPGGIVTLSNGLAGFNTSSLEVGTHTITVVYSGADSFCSSDSTSRPYIQVVNLPILPMTIDLTSSLNPAEFGTNILFTATLHELSTIKDPTGVVTFFDGSIAIGTSVLINGVAIIPSSTLTIGTHPITAVYSGDANFMSATSKPYIQVIIGSSTPSAPTNFYGCQTVNKYLNFNDIVNVLTWNPPQNNETIIYYEIYRDAALTEFVGSVQNQCPYRFEDGNRKKKKTYNYYIVSVNAEGKKSPVVATKVAPHRRDE